MWGVGHPHSTGGIPKLFTGDTLTLEGHLSFKGGWYLNSHGLVRGKYLITKRAQWEKWDEDEGFNVGPFNTHDPQVS